MIPIYEQGSGKGIGHNLSSFLSRFDEICAQHLAKGRAKSFALIIYDFTDQGIRKILKDQGVFTQLDRLSGNELSIFYLHSRRNTTIDTFNAHCLNALGIEGRAMLPCVVFFRVDEGAIKDVQIAQLENADLIHGFFELYRAIQQYLSDEKAGPTEPSRAIRWLKGSSEFLSVEIFRAALNKGMEFFF